jgi:Ca2+/Na+ antiporter
MTWNWGVFLKSWMFGFLGFLIGVVSIVIYLAVDVDLGKLDGLQILTAVLIVITIWYAYSTHRMLEEQRKSKKIGDIEKQLEKLYYPLMNILKNPPVWQIKDGEDPYIDVKKIDEIIP